MNNIRYEAFAVTECSEVFLCVHPYENGVSIKLSLPSLSGLM
jgi:hypothetical protein